MIVFNSATSQRAFSGPGILVGSEVEMNDVAHEGTGLMWRSTGGNSRVNSSVLEVG